MGARGGPRDGLGWVGRQRVLAGVRDRGGGGNGGSAGGGAHAREEMRCPFIADTRAGHLASRLSIPTALKARYGGGIGVRARRARTAPR
jgi:hypothetical protein